MSEPKKKKIVGEGESSTQKKWETNLCGAGGSGALEALLGGLANEALVDVGDNTTTGNGRADEGIEFLLPR